MTKKATPPTMDHIKAYIEDGHMEHFVSEAATHAVGMTLSAIPQLTAELESHKLPELADASRTVAGVVHTMAAFSVTVVGRTVDMLLQADTSMSESERTRLKHYILTDAASVIDQVFATVEQKEAEATADADAIITKATAGAEVSKPTLREIPAKK